MCFSAQIATFNQVPAIRHVQPLHLHPLTRLDVVLRIGLLLQLVQQLFRLLAYVDLADLPSLLELVRHHHVRPVNVVPHNLSTNYPSDNCASMHTDTHMQAGQFRFLPLDLFDHLYHVKCKIHHIFGLLFGIAVVAVGKAQHHIAVPDGVKFVDVVIGAEDIEFLEERSQHTDHILRFFPVLGLV